MPGIDEQIIAQNPWWLDPGAIARDRHLRGYHESRLHWTPPVLEVMPLRLGDTDTLRGPRQVGKTTSAKRLVQALLDRGEARVLYFSFDLVRDFREMPDVIARAKRLHPAPDGPWYMFLDEVTSVADWQVGIKYAWDQGLTRDDYLLLTGSSAHDLRRGAEQLPGRRGNGGDYLQLPMSFRDFARLAAGVDLPAETLSVHGCLTAEGRKALASLNLRLPELERAFDAYRRVGGFPAAVRDHLGGAVVAGEATIRVLWDAVAGDIARAGLDTVAALKLLEEVAISLGSALKWSGVARALDVSDALARRYVERLAESFALLTVYFWDMGGKTLSPARQRKVYYIDPLLASVPSRILPGAREPSGDALVENLVAVALFRSAARTLVQAGAVPGAIAYWRSSNGREIDFVVPTEQGGAARFPVEVKGDSGTGLGHARLAVRNAFGRGLVISRSTFDWADDVAILPAPVFLAALEERPRRELYVA